MPGSQPGIAPSPGGGVQPGGGGVQPAGGSGTTSIITKYTSRKIPPEKIASSTHAMRTSEGSMFIQTASPPATPPMTLSVGER